MHDFVVFAYCLHVFELIEKQKFCCVKLCSPEIFRFFCDFVVKCKDFTAVFIILRELFQDDILFNVKFLLLILLITYQGFKSLIYESERIFCAIHQPVEEAL